MFNFFSAGYCSLPIFCCKYFRVVVVRNTFYWLACLLACLLALLLPCFRASFHDWLTDWLAGWLAGWMAGWLAGWMAGWLVGWLAGWLTDWLTSLLTYIVHIVQKNYSFLWIVGTVKKIMKTSFNFIVSTTAESVERILKAVFELKSPKMT